MTAIAPEALALLHALPPAELLALRRLARASDAESRSALKARLKHLCGTLGMRIKTEQALLCRQQTMVTIVCNHFEEDASWIPALLGACEWVSIVVYDCGMAPLPREALQHERLEVRSKTGALAKVPFFYGVFDFCASEVNDGTAHDSQSAWYLFLHGHDTAWHQKLPVAALVALSMRAASLDPDLEYASLNDQLLPDWVTPGVDEWVAHGISSPSMLRRVASHWRMLQPLLGGVDAHGPPPEAIYEVHGAQALVAGARLRARPRAAWAALRDHVATLAIHSDADYAVEACFHRLFGEPWSRPFVLEHRDALLRGVATELELRCGCRYARTSRSHDGGDHGGGAEPHQGSDEVAAGVQQCNGPVTG